MKGPFPSRFWLLPMFLWLASLVLPSMDTATETVRGVDVLFVGPLGPLIGQFGWYGNLAFFPALSVAGWKPIRSVLDTFAIGLLMTAFVVNSAFWTTWSDFVAEGYPITAYRAGYFSWMAALSIVAIMLFARAFFAMKARRAEYAED